MKRLSAITLLFLAMLAHGSEENIRLSLVETELETEGLSSGLQKIIQINQDGVAYGILRGTHGESHKVYLRVFLRKEMNDLEQKISEVDAAPLIHRNAECLALPTKSFNYRAANGSIALYEATFPCGAYDRNQAPATKALLALLDALHLKFQEELET
ncbi:MAG: hypothetical protein KDD51_02140 [Bdellovibrionales bacterium]|nr:hypothetical protein [Bdellovibrionales bacterium]